MTLILSVENDYSTNQVIHWLRHYKKPFVRLNENDRIVIHDLTHDGFVFEIKGGILKFSEISSIWYRRGDLNVDTFADAIELKKSIFKAYNQKEVAQIKDYIYHLLSQKTHINARHQCNINKLLVLQYCKSNGLNKSRFIITQSKVELQKFFKEEKNIISKPVFSPFVYVKENTINSSYTYKMDKRDLKSIPLRFVPTFFQTEIRKKYEIRTFYLNKKFYSMAIFSQNNPKTKIDFRQYDWEYPNRTTPFKLPKTYERKLEKMLIDFDIDCASMDTLISSDDNYYMIDINPIGQLGMTSMPCNYNLEGKMAKYL